MFCYKTRFLLWRPKPKSQIADLFLVLFYQNKKPETIRFLTEH